MIDLRLGDCLDVMRTMPDGSVHCCVTSPPYFGLRDYGADGQIGLERTPDEFVAKMVAVFAEVRRVLRDDGTLWLNLGDSYAQNEIRNRNGKGGSTGLGEWARGCHQTGRKQEHGLKTKDLIGIPWRVAFALQADGWYLRSDIIWHKPNPIPESVRDRPTKSHEYLFLMSRSATYHYDADAVAEAATDMQYRTKGHVRPGTDRLYLETGDKGAGRYRSGMNNMRGGRLTRNRRSVWHVATRPFKGAHFATFPPKLIEPCILAGCPEGGTVLDPFNGAGTTGVVAKQHGRDYIGIDLNPDYLALADARIEAA